VSTNPANHTSTAATTGDDPPAGTRERGRLYHRLADWERTEEHLTKNWKGVADA
jgi:hypothetical protein